MREYTQLEAGDEHRGDLYSPVFTAPWIWNRVPMGKRIPLSYSSWNILPRVSIAALVFCLVGIGAAPGLLPADEPTIEISDVLDITVKNEPDLSVSRQVEESGTFSYPLLREIEAAGRTPSELARQIEKRLYDEEYLWKPKVTVEIKDRPGHDRRYALDSSKIRRELGWEPRVSFEEGISRTIKWYRDNAEWWRRIKSGEYREYYDKLYRGSWNALTVRSLSIGQGEILVTPFQLANLAATIGNRGFYFPPHFLKHIEGTDTLSKKYIVKKRFATISFANLREVIRYSLCKFYFT